MISLLHSFSLSDAHVCKVKQALLDFSFDLNTGPDIIHKYIEEVKLSDLLHAQNYQTL